jgi:hypothetical protein
MNSMTDGRSEPEITEQGSPPVDSTGIVQRADGLLRSTYGAEPGAAKDAGAGLPLLAAALPAKAGEVAEILLALANDGARRLPVRLIGTDLVSASGARIPSQHVTFPGAGLPVAPGGQLPAKIQVAVPNGCPQGSYFGLLQVVGQPDARALLSVKVV